MKCKKAILILSLISVVLPAALCAQDIHIDDLYEFYNRLNSGKLLPNDRQTLEYLQESTLDSLVIRKTFTDKNGDNLLEVKVINPCRHSENPEEVRFDGWINYVTASIGNNNYSCSLTYYNPDVAMSLIYLVESNISMISISGRQAVFIPFGYCGNADDSISIAYFVLYDHLKYLYHIGLRGENFENYSIVDDLDEKFKDLPVKLKKELLKLVRLQYKDVIEGEEYF